MRDNYEVIRHTEEDEDDVEPDQCHESIKDGEPAQY